MKKLIFFSVLSLMLFACNQNKTPSDSSTSSDNMDSTKNAMQSLYEKNLATLKNSISAFENEKIDEWASNIADDAEWTPPSYGSSKSNKTEWKKALSGYMADWDSLKLRVPNFLPGLDSTTHEFDGSVRYYGEWDGVHKSGKRTAVFFYGTYEFNKEGKISSGADFFDVGGLMNAVKSK